MSTVGGDGFVASPSAVNRNRHAGVFDGFAGIDLQDAIAIAGVELFAIEAMGEAEAAAPCP